MSRPQWFYDLTDPQKAVGSSDGIPASLAARCVKPVLFKSAGSDKGASSQVKKMRAHEEHLKVKRAWDTALAPVKTLFMNLVMTYFSGNSLQLVNITMTMYMFFLTPLSQILGVQDTFSPYEGSKSIRGEIITAKLVYVLCLSLCVAAGVWKVGQMGLLPTHASDWLSWESPAVYKVLS